MKVKLISYSQPSLEMSQEGIEDVQDLIAFCARVSNPANQYNSETAEKLINYLIKHAHWSPLEMASACLEIETTRDIAHQIVRHRSFAFQEFSQRYADPTKELNFMLREARLQDTKNRQNSISITEEDEVLTELIKTWELKQRCVIAIAEDTYKWAVENGIAKEQARAVLPEGLTSTRLYMNGTLRSWIHYIEVRASNGTQKEHMDIAKECAKVISQIFPMVNGIIE